MRKVVILGDSGVGKTALRIKLSGHELPAELVPTKGIDFAVATHRCGDSVQHLQLWDISGSERFTPLMDTSLCELTSMIFLVWDAQRPDTYESLQAYLTVILQKFPDLENPNFIKRNLPIIFICNKIDLSEREAHSKIAEWEKEFGLQEPVLVRVSTKEGKGLKELLDKAAELINHPTSEHVLQIESDSPLKSGENELEYEFHRIKHTRLVRVDSLKAIIKKNTEPFLPERETMWFFMHFSSIGHVNSKVSLWIKKMISLGIHEKVNPIFEVLRRANNEERVDIFPRIARFLKGKSKELVAIMELLSLLDEKERTFFGFKFFCRENGCEKNQNEMADILIIARRIYEECYLGSRPELMHSLRERVLEGFDEDKNSLPRAVQKIVDQYAPAPKIEKPHRSVCAML
jgi:small GTP-binding protein